MGLQTLENYGWLIDAPLFIDSAQVEQLCDAAMGTDEDETAGGLFRCLPERSRSRRKVDPVPGPATRSAARQLARLLLGYKDNTTGVLQIDGRHADVLFQSSLAPCDAPRLLVVLDLPPSDAGAGTKLVPLAAETGDGQVVMLHSLLREAHDRRHGKVRRPSAGDDQWREYFERYDPWQAMQVLLDGVAGRRIRWLDFRAAVGGSGGQSVNLHLVPAEKYDTGLFAFQMVQRGAVHGLRVVAALKAGGDLNVLAVYEK